MKQKLSAKNAKFWALPKAEKRIAIAKDIIKQVNAKKIIPRNGAYLYTEGNRFLEGDLPLDNLFKQMKCEACALGACFISLVNNGDKLKLSDITLKGIYYSGGRRLEGVYDVSELGNDDKWRKYLRKIFSPHQLTLIESAFEHKTISDMEDRSKGTYMPTVNSKLERAINFNPPSYLRDSSKNLIAICTNIIKNKGTFKP